MTMTKSRTSAVVSNEAQRISRPIMFVWRVVPA